MCTNDSDIEARFAELATEFYKAAEDKMKVRERAIAYKTLFYTGTRLKLDAGVKDNLQQYVNTV